MIAELVCEWHQGLNGFIRTTCAKVGKYPGVALGERNNTLEALPRTGLAETTCHEVRTRRRNFSSRQLNDQRASPK